MGTQKERNSKDFGQRHWKGEGGGGVEYEETGKQQFAPNRIPGSNSNTFGGSLGMHNQEGTQKERSQLTSIQKSLGNVTGRGRGEGN